MDWEKKVHKFLDAADAYINNVILAPNLPLTTIIFFRIIPWIFITILIGFILQPVISFFVGFVYWLIYEVKFTR